MASGMLDVALPALRAASAIIAGHGARVTLPSGPAAASAETSGVAAAAFDGAFEGFSAALSQRLALMSAALAGAADSFTAMEDANSRALASVAPLGLV